MLFVFIPRHFCLIPAHSLVLHKNSSLLPSELHRSQFFLGVHFSFFSDSGRLRTSANTSGKMSEPGVAQLPSPTSNSQSGTTPPQQEPVCQVLPLRFSAQVTGRVFPRLFVQLLKESCQGNPVLRCRNPCEVVTRGPEQCHQPTRHPATASCSGSAELRGEAAGHPRDAS